MRISGVNLNPQKHIKIALTSVYGIGLSRSLKICAALGVDPATKVIDLAGRVAEIQKAVSEYEVEGDLKRRVATCIKKLKDIGCYRGIRHRKGLPVRGQRTRTNAKTRKKRNRAS